MGRSQIEPKVFVIVPNKNGLQHLHYSIPSLMSSAYKNYCCVFVDNNSTDESLSFIEKKYPDIPIINNKRGKGFASTVNLGIKYALEQGADYIAVYNSDIKVLPQWIDHVIGIFSSQSNVGLIGYNEIPKEREELFYNTQNLTIEYKEVEGLSGCLFICPSHVFKHIGLFDEEYFMYGEDNDFFSRLIRAGYSILQTNIPVWHYGEGSAQNKTIRNSWLTYRNAVRCSIKNESIFKIFRVLAALLYHGCNPFFTNKTNDISLTRLRRYNVVVNFGLIILSCCWNLIYLPKTLRCKAYSNELINHHGAIKARI